MDRNTIIGIILIFAIIVVYSIVTKPTKQQLEEAKRRRDSIELVQKQEALNRISPSATRDSLQNDTATMAAKKLQEAKELKNEFGAFSQNLEGTRQFYTLENNLVRLVVSNKGGRPYSVELKKYHRYDSLPLVLFSGDSTRFSLEFFAQNRNISTQDMYFKPVGTNPIQVNDSAQSLTLRLEVAPNRYIDYIYSVKPNSYMVDFRISLNGMDSLIASNSGRLDLDWQIYSPQQEKGRKNEIQYTTLYYKYADGEVESFNSRSTKPVSSDIPNRLQWIAFKQQFFSAVLINKGNFLNASLKSETEPDSTRYLKRFSAVAGLPYESKPTVDYNMQFYFGPNSFNTLKKYHMNLEELVTVGKWIVKWINQFVIIPIFNFLNKYISSYGLIILILTLIIKITLLPLTYRSYYSMAKMRVLKPQIDEINEKFPKEKQMEKQQALMGLYKRAGVNPMGGCLPLLLQMPILFAMFRFFPTSIELRQQPFLWATDLSTYDSIISWSTNIPIISTFYGNHVSLWTILMTITTILSIKMNDQATASSTQMPGMKTMMYVMPVMFMFILNNFSSALTYYYFLTNVVTFGQNYLFKALIDENALLKQINENKKKPAKKSKWQERLEEAAKQRGYNPKK